MYKFSSRNIWFSNFGFLLKFYANINRSNVWIFTRKLLTHKLFNRKYLINISWNRIFRKSMLKQFRTMLFWDVYYVITYHREWRCSSRGNPRWIPDRVCPIAIVCKVSRAISEDPWLADTTVRIALHFSRCSKREEDLSSAARSEAHQSGVVRKGCRDTASLLWRCR